MEAVQSPCTLDATGLAGALPSHVKLISHLALNRSNDGVQLRSLRSVLLMMSLVGLTGCSGPAPAVAPRVVKTPIAHAPIVSHDFGKVASDTKGPPPTAMFVVENRGEEVLKIIKLSSSCGCTVSSISKMEIPSGQKAVVTAEVQNIGLGDHRASITLQTNDPLHREFPLRLTWHGTARLQFDVAELNFGNVSPGQPIERTFNIRRTSLKDHPGCVLKEITCRDSSLNIEMPASSGDSLAGLTPIKVTLTPTASLGANEATLTARFTSCSLDQLFMQVKWNVRRPVEASPATLFLGRGKPGEMLTGKVVVSAGNGNKLKIKACWVEPADAGTATVKANEKTPTIAEISVTIKVPDKRPQPGYKLLIDCEEPASESLEIPVNFFVDSANPT